MMRKDQRSSIGVDYDGGNTMNKATRVRTAYFLWLCKIVERRGSDAENREIVEMLHNKEFYGYVPNDDNRAMDGIKLRECFARETDLTDVERYLNGPCTMLEMLVALAQRMDDILYDLDRGSQCPKWFWLLIENLGLESYLCDDPDVERKKRLNDLIIKKLLERTYAENGKGGLFPLKNPHEDQRQIEIWYQMMTYVDEYYPL